MSTYIDGAIHPATVTLSGLQAERVTFTTDFRGGVLIDIGGQRMACVKAQDLLNAARLMGANDITDTRAKA